MKDLFSLRAVCRGTVALALAILLAAQPVLACDICAVYSQTEAQGGTGKGFFAGTAEQFTHMGTLQEDSEKVANTVGQRLVSSVSQVFAGYNFNDRFGLQLNLPVIYRSYIRPRGSVIEHGTVDGIGDLSLLGRYTVYQRTRKESTISLGVLGGLKLPTGNPSLLSEPEVENEPPLPPSGIAGHDLALGSGSVDGIIGGTFSVRWEHLFVNGGVQYAIRTEGSFGHQYANDLSWSGGPGYYFALREDYTLSLQVVVSGEAKGKDSYYGVKDDDSAETIVYFGPQFNFTWTDKLSVQAGLDLPVSIDNTGLQVVPDYRIHAAVTWRF
jgi:hypothetical protein